MNQIFFQASSPEHQKREKAKARELRSSQWWKQQLGKGLCYHCKQRFKPAELTMEHLVPIARGGKSDKKNCVPCCKECNSKKGHKLSVEQTMDQMSSELTRLQREDDESEGNQ
jgi:5-methylcytosine-specific restriction enzyme A